MAMRVTGLMLGTTGRPWKVRMDGINYLIPDAHDLVHSWNSPVFGPILVNLPAWGDLAVEAAFTALGNKTLVARLDATHTFDLYTWQLPCPPMKVFAFGDSIQWGQGLNPRDKIYQLVAARLSVQNNGAEVIVANMAGSGAQIGPIAGITNVRDFGPGGEDPSGEAPDTRRTVLSQIRRAPGAGLVVDRSVDVILVDGGINDVGVRNILRYVDNRDNIQESTLACGPRITSVLQLLAGHYPDAIIVLTGYYPIVTRRSSPNNLSRLALASAAMAGGVLTTTPLSPAQKRWMVLNCEVFYYESNPVFSAAVSTVNAMLTHPRVYFVLPGFGDTEALLAPGSQLWGIDGALSAQDPMRFARRTVCKKAFGKRPISYTICKLASVGHPTGSGAARYAEQIFTTLFNDPVR